MLGCVPAWYRLCRNYNSTINDGARPAEPKLRISKRYTVPDVDAPKAKGGFVRDPLVRPARSERVVWIWHLISDFNGRFGDMRCIATINLLQARGNAASAIAARTKGGFVRTPVVRSGRSECRLLDTQAGAIRLTSPSDSIHVTA